jgi:hypothetical protein|mmetsp:Transcript_108159/g.169185  ORF Transcript_108159/g.169185 Transcript_108159/m.169185 type:complete len:97 (-) Transcript_108159:127-417(-)
MDFQTMLSEFFNSAEDGKPRASTLLVALHNIVTSTVTPKYIEPGRLHYYCVPEALRALRSSAIFQDSATELDEKWMPASLGVGLGVHRLKNCTPVS